MNRKRAVLTLFATVLIASSVFAVGPLPPYTSWPCQNAAGSAYPCLTPDPHDCYTYRSYSIREALQFRSGDGRSARSNQSPDDLYGICPGNFAWCQISPQIGGASAEIVQNPDGGRDVLFSVQYDFPNNYCQVDADDVYRACGAGIWPPKLVLATPVTRLMIVDGSSGQIRAMAPAIFESGTWQPRLNVGCGGGTKTYRIIATNLGSQSPSCGPNPTAEVTVSVTFPEVDGHCNPDRWCPSCPVENQPPGSGGAPIAFGSGDVSLPQTLFTIGGQPLPLTFAITYHSAPPMYPGLVSSPMGSGWTHTFNDTLRAVGTSRMILYRVDGDGHETQFEGWPGGPWFPVAPAELSGRQKVTLSNGQYVLTDINGTVIRYDAATGHWLSTTDRWGNALTATYSGTALTGVTDSNGRTVTFASAGGVLTAVTLPTGESWRFQHDGVSLSAIFDPIHTGATPWRTFEYVNDSRGVPRLLSAMRDEAGALLEGHAYDALGRGLTSVSEGGRDSVTVTYVAPGRTHVETSIDGAVKQVSDYTMRYKGGRWLATSIAGSCASCGASSNNQSFTLDDRNRVTSRTDGNGHVTQYAYDFAGNVLSRTDAFGTAKQRKTIFLREYAPWPAFVTRILEPSAAKPGATKTTTFTWNANETVLTRTELGFLSPTDGAPTTFTSTTTFDNRHRVVASDGPRTDVQDVTSSTYFPDGDANLARRGRLQRTTDAAGLTRTFDDYDIYGTARKVVDANGVVMTLITDARGRVTSTTSQPVAADANESTPYTSDSLFDGRDRMTEATTPRGNRTRYEYEGGTNRVTSVTRLDDAGNEVERRHMTLNDVGGKIREEDQACATAAAGVCLSWQTRRSESYVYDNHNRLAASIHAAPAGSKVAYTYDADGKIASIQDENHTSPNTSYAYDALGRLTSVTQTLATAPGGVAITRYDYDVMDNLIAVTDPNANVTRYAFDDFGRMTRQESPVTGTTTYSYDRAGNLVSTTDARGATTARTYDALGRVLSAVATHGGSSETVTFSYDDPTPGNYGLGRLRTMSDPSGSTTFAYERRGLVRTEVRSILGDTYTTAFTYDASGNRIGVTYPSGRRVVYTFDYADRPLSLSGTFNGMTKPYITSTTYEPFGPESVLVYDSMRRNATYDQRYRLTSFNVLAGTTPIAQYRYGYDAAANITAIVDDLDPRFSRSFGYDDLHRLTRADGGAALWGSGTYMYDAMGNQLASSLGSKLSAYVYAGTTSKLASVTEGTTTRGVAYDPAGNEQQVGNTTFVYSPRNYLDRADGLRYIYDGTGLRVAQVGLAIGPVITSQPRSQSVCPGSSVTLRVMASGASAYQWQSFNGTNWNDLTGATASSLVVTPTAPTQYRVVVSNAAASTFSDAATVTPTALGIEPSSGILYGDLNRDGAVNASDVAILRSVLTGNASLAIPQAVADLNGDTQLDALDLSLVAAFTNQTIACLPQFPASSATAFAVITPTQTALNPTQYFFYTPEKSLLSQTEIKAAGGTPQIAIDYLWFNGHPVAEERLITNETRLTFTDHLGTPLLQASPSGSLTWHAEYEPYGNVYRMRIGTVADQRLRFPGQEFDEQMPEREYNIFRWYRAGWGRYTQADPLNELRASEPNLYRYAAARPTGLVDRFGLWAVDKSCDCAPGGYSFGGRKAVQAGVDMVCNKFLKRPPCASFIENLQFGPTMDNSKIEPLGPCMRRLCKDDKPIYCAQNTDPRRPNACAKANPGGALTMMRGEGTVKGEGNCYFDIGMGWSHTIFHEMVHVCGLTAEEDESYNSGGLSGLFRKIMMTCAGVPY